MENIQDMEKSQHNNAQETAEFFNTTQNNMSVLGSELINALETCGNSNQKALCNNDNEESDTPVLKTIEIAEGEIAFSDDEELCEKIKPDDLLVPHEEYQQSIIKMDLFNMQFRRKLSS